ncbi:MAG: HD-GYP domain-containing protein [Treponema sp.]|jgi:HD-GYP domain-containing protein (c-di-GMP phosphodiesterase class II)|nr:HD-GYP domain-containing protein [Treponema sp.]
MVKINEQERVRTTYEGLVERVAGIFIKIVTNRFVPADPFRVIAEKIYDEAPHFLEFILETAGQQHGLAKNAVDTAILSACIAKTMGFTDFTIRTVILGALVHDVGMLCIPQDILEIKKTLAKAEQQYIFVHPIHGYKVIVQEFRYPKEVGAVALQHHEYWDGTGYPQGLSGTTITTAARIIALGDVFSAMTAPRSYRVAMTGHQAMQQLVSGTTTHFDPEILKVFVSFVGMYPRGSLVRLNTGAIARVIDQTEIRFKPRIRMITEASGEPYAEVVEINLAENRDWFITGDISGTDGIPIHRVLD